MADQVNLELKTLAEGFKTSVDKLYPVLIKQAYIDGYMKLLWSILWFVLFVVCVVVIVRSIKAIKKINIYYKTPEMKEEDLNTIFGSDDDAYMVVIFIATCLSIIFLACFFGEMGDTLKCLLNPDWYVIEMILDKLPGK